MIYGMRGTTLGYETGEYLDKMMTGAEAEIRWMAWARMTLARLPKIGPAVLLRGWPKLLSAFHPLRRKRE